jgi:hypothetical protein
VDRHPRDVQNFLYFTLRTKTAHRGRGSQWDIAGSRGK